MVSLLKTYEKAILAMAVAAALPLMAAPRIARPGTVNYSEGNVALDGRTVAARDLGNLEVAPGQTLQTADGRAEILLTPGVFVRLSQQSALRMDSASLTDTRVNLIKGEAMVEVDQIAAENNIQVTDAGAVARLEKKGIYDFNATQPEIAVYDGKAEVQFEDRTIEIGKGKRLDLTGTAVKPAKFDRKEAGALYNWSKLRSGYLADVNASTAQTVVGNGLGWYGTGWYWNPWFDSWAFLPGAGYLYSPFGYGFYSPGFVYAYGPVFYRGYRGPRGYRGGRPPVVGTPAPAGGTGVTFGHTGRASGGFSGPRMSAPRMAAPAGGGVHFGGGRR